MRHDLVEALHDVLQTNHLGQQATWHGAIDSTNTQARRAARDGAPHGLLIVSDAQHAGRGRFDRHWESAEGRNLLFSLVVRPTIELQYLGWISLAAALSVAEAIEAFTSRPAYVKWPNDVLLSGKKVCGILIESILATGASPALILGIGLNVNQDAFGPLLHRATSLLLETGQHIDRVGLLAHILLQLERHIGQLKTPEDRAALRARYHASLIHYGETIDVYQRKFDTPITGVCEGVGHAGELLLRTAAGTRALHAGDVSLRAG